MNTDSNTTTIKKTNFLKKKVVRDILQLIVGVILLAFSYQYLMQHPAERTSIVSGVTILSQKINVLVHSIFTKDGATLDEKYKIEGNFREILNTMDKSKCLTLQDYQEVESYLNSVKSMDLETYRQQRPSIFNFLNNYLTRINKECK